MKQTPLWRLGLSCFGAHIGAIIICSILVLSLLTFWDNIVYQIVVTLFGMLIYWAIVSSTAWRFGNKDLNKVHFKHIEYDPWKGTKIGLMASIPIFAVNLLLVLAHFIDMGVVTTYGLVAYRLLNPHVMIFINLVIGEGPKTVADVSLWQLIISFVFTLCLLASVISGYILGYKDIIFADKIIYKKKK
jgi:hypothetical protein